ncbi:hypothetical protein BBJ28_00012965 [Nothophytophthora sp. Chile5]|nr:hypothetical protein BBJ28_00012965 [Nothophytophthora sp. Chile5]
MARKRRGAEASSGVQTPSVKKARVAVTPQTASRVSALDSSNGSGGTSEDFRLHVSGSNESVVQQMPSMSSHPESEEYEEDQAEAEEEAEEDEEGAMPLVVFQCSTCRSIFGDSYAFVCSTEALWLVTLSAATNVAQAPEVQTAQDGPDAGSSYFELLCQNCQAVLGRKYLATPVALDSIRDLYSFSTEAITSYTLGDPMRDADASVQGMQQAAMACSNTLNTLAADRDEMARLREEMEKVKGLMVTVDERLAQLEESEQADSEEEGEQDGDETDDAQPQDKKAVKVKK